MTVILEIPSLFKLSLNNIGTNIKSIKNLPPNVILDIVSKACKSEKPFKLKNEKTISVS
ncbi:hypothetical protein MXB_2727, partial [Myxobolus squamalis]